MGYNSQVTGSKSAHATNKTTGEKPAAQHRRMNRVLSHMPFPNVPDHIRARMASIGKTNTKPELRVRRILHQLGFRFRLHRVDLPGTPDVVLPKHGIIILVHGCFWHQHGCHLGKGKPRTNPGYWLPKLQRNIARDKEVRRELAKLGWRVSVVWECQTRNSEKLARRLERIICSGGQG